MQIDKRTALLALYRELDAELSALGTTGCAGCGKCCRFDKTDHILYAGGLERELFSEARRPATPDSPELIPSGLACPFQVAGKCAARETRALGCRIHFCDAVQDTPGWDFSERWYRRLKELHEDFGISWDYRPLLPLP
jgi:hypothetical protein